MAIKLVSKTNTDPISGTYPYGKIRDDVAPGTGTPVSTQVYGDFHQFFARMAALAGVTLNDLPENNTNGFQYNEAFKLLTHPDWTSVGVTFPSSPPDYDFADVGAPQYDVAYKTMQNEVALCGVFGTPYYTSGIITQIMQLPSGAEPSMQVYVTAQIDDGTGNIAPFSLIITTSGEVVPAMTLPSSATGYIIYLDGITYRK